MKTLRCLVVIVIAAVSVTDVPTQAQSVIGQLREGFEKERAGDLDGAIQIYQQIIANTQANQRHVAQAHYRLGKCYLEKGDKDKAAKQFEQLVSGFPRKLSAVGRARRELRKLKRSERIQRPERTKSQVRPGEPEAKRPVRPKGPPKVISTNPNLFADNVPAVLRTISVSFDKPMKDRSWSWMQFDRNTYPEVTGQPTYDREKRTCILPVKLKPGTVYLIGVNSGTAKNFRSSLGQSAKPYMLLFATRDAEGNPTPIPREILARAKAVNSGAKPTRRYNVEGQWLGTLEASGIKLRVVFKIASKPDGSLTATIDSPDQGAKDLPVDEVTFKNGKLHLEAKAIQGTFVGRMKTDGSTIAGNWTQFGQTLPLTVKRVDKIPGPKRPQEPKKPYPYNQEEVVYENKKDGVKLAGTLTFPRSGGPFAAVLLITGSGPQDRDETVMGHKPFLVLADHLTRQGIATLRVDDRGVGGSTGNCLEATSEDFARDVLAGVEYLKNRNQINPKQIGLIGHSEGGIIAPMAAVQSPDVAFIVMMAGTGLTGEEVLYLQNDLILKATGASDEMRTVQRGFLQVMFAILKKQEDPSAKDKIRKLIRDRIAMLSEEEEAALQLSEATVDLQIRMAFSPWFRFFLTYDPKPTLSKVKCPVLAIAGEKDVQVAPKENLEAIEQALKAGGNTDYTVKELPNLNHRFQTAQTGSLLEYATIEETISPVALDLISNWIKQHTADKPIGGDNGMVQQPDSAYLIQPLVGMGKLRFGMTIKQAKEILGEPQRTTGRAHWYLNSGFAIAFGRDGTVATVMCGDAGVPDSPLIRNCKCRTDKDIGMGSSRQTIISAYGEPSSTREHFGVGNLVTLAYSELNAQFVLRDSKLVHMTFSRKSR